MADRRAGATSRRRSPATRRAPIWTADPKNTPYRDAGQEPAPGRLRGQARLRVGGRGGRLHHRQHGGRGGSAARRRRRKRWSGRRSAPSATTGSDDALRRRRPASGLVRGIAAASPACPSTRRSARIREPHRLSLHHDLSRTTAEQPQRARAAVHAAGGGAAAAVPDLSARARLLARLHRRQGRPRRRVDRPRELRVPVGRRGHAAGALQHALLHDRRQRHQVRPRPLAGAAAQPQHPLQDLLSRRHPAALHRADGALGDRLLVDLRRPVLDHQLDAGEDGPDRQVHRFPRRPVERAPRR